MRPPPHRPLGSLFRAPPGVLHAFRGRSPRAAAGAAWWRGASHAASACLPVQSARCTSSLRRSVTGSAATLAGGPSRVGPSDARALSPRSADACLRMRRGSTAKKSTDGRWTFPISSANSRSTMESSFPVSRFVFRAGKGCTVPGCTDHLPLNPQTKTDRDQLMKNMNMHLYKLEVRVARIRVVCVCARARVRACEGRYVLCASLASCGLTCQYGLGATEQKRALLYIHVCICVCARKCVYAHNARIRTCPHAHAPFHSLSLSCALSRTLSLSHR